MKGKRLFIFHKEEKKKERGIENLFDCFKKWKVNLSLQGFANNRFG
jgi:hypothetical protein